MESKAIEAVAFFEEKGRRFGNEFSALFSRYGINSPVNGNTIANAINEQGKRFAKEISTILSKGADSEGEELDGFGEKLKEYASKGKDVLQRYEATRKSKEGSGDDEGETKKQSTHATAETSKKPIFIAVGAFIFLVIIIIIIAKATK